MTTKRRLTIWSGKYTEATDVSFSSIWKWEINLGLTRHYREDVDRKFAVRCWSFLPLRVNAQAVAMSLSSMNKVGRKVKMGDEFTPMQRPDLHGQESKCKELFSSIAAGVAYTFRPSSLKSMGARMKKSQERNCAGGDEDSWRRSLSWPPSLSSLWDFFFFQGSFSKTIISFCSVDTPQFRMADAHNS